MKLLSCIADAYGVISGTTQTVHACRGSKAVLFVLDQFERFAARTKQAVLYTLLDALQTTNMQVRHVFGQVRISIQPVSRAMLT